MTYAGPADRTRARVAGSTSARVGGGNGGAPSARRSAGSRLRRRRPSSSSSPAGEKKSSTNSACPSPSASAMAPFAAAHARCASHAPLVRLVAHHFLPTVAIIALISRRGRT